MNLRTRFSLSAFTLIGALVCFGAVGCGRAGNAQSGDIAIVDGEAITADDYHKFLEVKPQVKVMDAQGRATSANVAQTLGYQAMSDLIRQTVIRHLAKDENVYPTDADVLAELEFQKKRNPNFLRQVQMQGLTVEQIKSNLSLSLVIERLLTKGITVTDDEVNTFIKDNPDQFKEPATADLDWIVVTSEDDKKQVDAELASGQRFVEVAKRYSKADGARQMQGKFPQRNMNAFSPQLKDVIEKTPELKATDWQKNGTVWAKWFVEKKTPSKPITIDDTMKTYVKRQLAIQRGNAANDLDKRVAAKMKDSKIEVKLPSFQPLWKEDMDNLNQALAPANAPATAPSTAPSTAPTTGATTGGK